MTTQLEATPHKAPYPLSNYLSPTAFERSNLAQSDCSIEAGASCQIPVQVGIFFDGTNNHMERDRHGKREPVPMSSTEIAHAKAQARQRGLNVDAMSFPPPIPNLPLHAGQWSHSNVARLFESFPRRKQSEGFHPFYIQGVGTPFEEIGEPTESQGGKVFASGGLPRIIWGALQVLNAIHSTVYGGDFPLYKTVDVGQLAQAYPHEVGRTDPLHAPQQAPTHEEWFAPHIALLQAALAAKPKPAVPSLTLSVFGFSRGAAEAVAFCHLFDRLLDGGKLAGIPATIRFVGLFDVVATVGGSASMALTLPVPGALFDGHWDWANDVVKPLPGCVQKALHLIAAHELRMNFPVTRIGGAQEVLFPGVHSDVGGGYAPGDQGRSRGGQRTLLSQIPLAFMYKAALMAGVPLTPFNMLEATDRDDFEISAPLAQAWEAYTAALEGEGGQLSKHMELFYRWRAARLTTLASTASFQAAGRQGQQDLREANAMLAGDLEALRYRRDAPSARMPGEEGSPAFGVDDCLRVNQWHRIRANSRTPLDDWERFALGWFDKPEPLPAAVEAFFDDYVHDSFAGFYMAGEMTEFEKRVKGDEVMKKHPLRLNSFEKKVVELTRLTQAAERKRAAGEPLTKDEEALLKDAASGPPYPTMTDEDAADLREFVITTQTATRREGGGYLIRRGYYPHEGFFVRRSRFEAELRPAPVSIAGSPAQEKAARARAEAASERAPMEFAWSTNLRRDIHAAASAAL